jgi:hypothetical protein
MISRVFVRLAFIFDQLMLKLDMFTLLHRAGRFSLNDIAACRLIDELPPPESILTLSPNYH